MRPPRRSRFLLHVLGIDDQLVDDVGQPRQREIERDRRVGADHALDRGMRDVALVPQRDILQRRRHRRAHDAGEAGQVLGQHRIALVRHGRRALLPFARNIPPPPAPRCAADGGSRWRAARPTRRRRRARRRTRRGGRAGSPGSRPARASAPASSRHAPRPADRCWRRCRPRRKSRRSRFPRAPRPAAPGRARIRRRPARA